MQKLVKFISIMGLALVPFGVFAQNIPDSSSETVKQTISTLMAQHQVPGVAVELYVDGKPYSYFYGYAKPQRKVPVTDKTIFELGSVSKIMTGMLLAHEIDIAKMELNDSAEKFVKDLPDSFDDVSVQDLATNTSGLPFDVPENVATRSQLKKYLATWAPEHNAGEHWIYSNMGVGILGYAVERAGHRGYNQLYRKYVTAPLGMQPVGLVVPPYLRNNYAQGFDKEGNPAPHMDAKLFPAATGIKASANDMRLFLAAAIGLPGTPMRVLYPMRMTQAGYVKIPHQLQGLGWEIHQFTAENHAKLYNEPMEDVPASTIVLEQLAKPLFYNDALIDKSGATNGFRSYIAVLPDKKSGIVILANKDISKAAVVRAGREILFKVNKIESTVKQ